MEPSFNSVGGIIGVQDHLVVRPSIEARSLQEFAKWLRFNKMRFGLLVRDCAQCIGQALTNALCTVQNYLPDRPGDNFIFFNVANIIPSLKFRPTPTEFKENFYWFILCFRKFGAFSIFFIPTGPKKSRFCHFLATCK